MIKVLVADDNSLVRQSIISTLDWGSAGCEVIGEAADGLEALNLAREFCPDLIITDIKMPEMDGLQLTEEVKKSMPTVKVIIITGYDEFTFAQRAIKLGAFDLILKPIDNGELYEIILKAVSELKRESSDREEKDRMLQEKWAMQNEMLKSMAEINKKYIIDIIQGVPLDEIVFQESNPSGLTFKKHSLFIIKPDLLLGRGSDPHREEISQLVKCSQAVLKSLEKLYGFDFIHFWLDYGIAVVAIPYKPDTDRNLNIKMMDICNRVSEYLRNETELVFAIGISNVHNGLNEVRSAYCEALSALDCKFFIDNKVIIHAGALESRSILNEYPIMKKINLIYEHIRTGEVGLESLVDEVFSEIRENETKDSNYVKSLMIDICLTARRVLLEKSNYSCDILKGSSDIHSDISSFSSISQTFKYVKDFILQIFDITNSEQKKEYTAVTKKVIDYLNDNYNRKISLQEISDVVSLSPAHLSRIIKRDVGESYVDLFNHIKINIAVRLLKDTNLKVYEVANRVGIENYAYFYQLFKKVTGIAPTEYSR